MENGITGQDILGRLRDHDEDIGTLQRFMGAAEARLNALEEWARETRDNTRQTKWIVIAAAVTGLATWLGPRLSHLFGG